MALNFLNNGAFTGKLNVETTGISNTAIFENSGQSFSYTAIKVGEALGNRANLTFVVGDNLAATDLIGEIGCLITSDGGALEGAMSFKTNSGDTLTERMVISSEGALRFNAYGAGTLITDASGNITVSSGGGTGGPYLPLAGGTLTGNLTGTTIGLTGGITADHFRTNAGNTGYNLLTRNNTGSALYVQAAQSNTNQQIAKFSYGSATAGAGNTVLQVAKDESYFVNCNVGIGTTSPDTKLEIEGAIPLANRAVPLDILTITGEGSNLPYTGSGGGIVFKNRTYNYGLLKSARIRSYIDSDSASNRGAGLVFEVTNSSQTYNASLFLKYNGNVGIGTTSPGAKLDILKNDNTVYDPAADDGQRGVGPTIQLNNNSTTTNTFGQIMYDSDSSSQAVARMVFLDAGSSSSAIAFVTENGNQKGERMRIAPDGGVGIGTTSPDANLSVAGATSTNDLIGGFINLATSYGWTIPSGTFSNRVGYYGGDFILNGAAAENGMVRGIGPFNERQLLWTTTGSTDSNSDGGWNKNLTNLDINSSYQSVVYFKRVSTETSGTFYHGTGTSTNQITNLDGTSNTNPYFNNKTLVNFDRNVWYVSVGVIQSNNDSNLLGSTLAGIYRLDTGVKVFNSNTFKFGTAGATLTKGHRTYLYYSTDVNVVAQFALPGFYKINGNEPKISDITRTSPSETFWSASGNDIYNSNSGNVGIGATNPTFKLDIGSALNSNNVFRINGLHSRVLLSGTVNTPTNGVGMWNFINHAGTNALTRFYVQDANNVDARLTFRFTGNGGNNEILSGSSTGNVGIGTTSPGAKLDVEDTTPRIRLSSTRTTTSDEATVGAIDFYTADTSSEGQNVNAKIEGFSDDIYGRMGLRFFTGGEGAVTEKIRIAAGGNVGIGTTTTVTDNRLKVIGGSDYQTLNIGESQLNNTIKRSGLTATHYAVAEQDISMMSVYSSSTSTAISIGGSAGTLNAAMDIRFYTASNTTTTTGTQRMVVRSSGNVGIGTNEPTSKLHVSGGTSIQTTLTIGADGTNNDKSSKLFFNEGEAGTTDSKDFGFSLAYDGSAIAYPGLAGNEFGIIRHNNSANGDVVMKMTRTSNNTTFTGILTSLGSNITNTSTATLNLRRNITGTSQVVSEINMLNTAAPGTDDRLALIRTSTEGGATTTRGGLMTFFTRTGGSGAFNSTTYNNIGNWSFPSKVGINETNPFYQLDVDGTIRATGDVIAYSDARVKENVVTIDNALDKVTRLRGVTYTRKDIENKETKMGVIAQEVLEVVPEVVHKDDDGMYAVAYGNMNGLLIEAIKELKAEIEELKSRL